MTDEAKTLKDTVAIQRIQNVLKQLTPNGRARVLAFVNSAVHEEQQLSLNFAFEREREREKELAFATAARNRMAAPQGTLQGNGAATPR